jgi:Kef-type K+ transport system membrane component KefB/Trk K+ transport system NAD-binding subunit
MEIFLEISKIIGLATLVAIIIRFLKQPLIIGYILAGIIAGPFLLRIITSFEVLSIFSQIGVAMLLFIVGLNLNPKVIKETGKVSLVTGIGQVVFTSFFGFFITRFFGFSILESLYIAVALTFSSTIIIMKLLSDKGDLDTLYGKISIGFLIVQDLIAVFILIAISSTQAGFDLTNLFLNLFLKGIALLIGLFLIGYFVLPSVTRFIAKSQEVLLLFSIAWVFTIASLFHYLNFSIETGALMAGIVLSLSSYRFEIIAKMKPLRDFFIVLFFISLGSQMEFANILSYLAPIISLSLFVLIGNPLIVMILMGLLGYTRRTSFLAGLTVAQISEFSLILVALGIKVGHLNNDILFFITAIGLLTIIGSTYLILYADKIYLFLSPLLKIFERKGKKVDEHKYHENINYEIFLFGCDRVGYDLITSFENLRKNFLVFDYNPEIICSLAKKGINCRYADAGDLEFLNELNFKSVKMVISTIPDLEINSLLINKVKQLNQKTVIITVSNHVNEAIELYNRGATYVMMPHFLVGYRISNLIEKYDLDLNKFLKERSSHLKFLIKKRVDRNHTGFNNGEHFLKS